MDIFLDFLFIRDRYRRSFSQTISALSLRMKHYWDPSAALHQYAVAEWNNDRIVITSIKKDVCGVRENSPQEN